MTKRLKTILLSVMSGLFAVCLAIGMIGLSPLMARADGAETASDVRYGTVAVHDPSIVLAYEDADGNTYPEGGSGRTKVYYVFGTQFSQAKSYDLVNWTSFTNNLNIAANAYAILAKEAAYSGLTQDTIIENCWAPDVIWNEAMGKWCMYLSVNGANQYSSIVMLTADRLDGAWSYGGAVTYSRITNSNIGSTDYTKVTGDSTVDAKYSVYRNSFDNLLYGVNAIDAAVTYDENGDLWMSYGSWFGGIYLLKLDKYTGLRDYTYTYENKVDGTIASGESFTAYSDEYLGIHLAGGHHVSGEGSYLLKIDGWWYLFLSYGGYAPDGGYNMRVFRSASIAGPYADAAGNKAIVSSYVNNTTNSTGVRVMSGYTWSWWDHSYISQGHNSAFIDDDGNAYLVYHNKYTDGTIFHVLKVHQLLVNTDGWLVTSPFEAVSADAVAKGLSPEEIAGTYGVIYMTRDNGTYNEVCKEAAVTFAADGTLTGAYSGSWTYNSETGAFRVRISGGYAHNGYLMYQNLEGTNIRTLVFTAVSTEGTSVSQYTYWGYRYPSTEQQAQYVLNSLALPDKIGIGYNMPTGTKSNELWDKVEVTLSYLDGKLTASYLDNGESKNIEKKIESTEKIAEYGTVSVGQVFAPLDTSNGISISFDYANYTSDWTTILSGNGFSVNLSVIEYGSTNIYESAAINSGLVGSAANHEIFYTDGTARATISFNTDGSICFFLNGTLALKYSADAKFNDGNTTIGTVCAAILAQFENGTVLTEYDLSNVVFDVALSSELTTEKMYEIDGGYYTVTYGEAEKAINTNTGWWAGSLGESTLPVGDNALSYRYTRNHNYTDNAIQMIKPGDIYATFYPYGSLTEWPNDWQKDGSVEYYLNGSKLSSTSGINTGNVEGSTSGFWFGTYEITFLRYDNSLYVICDFTRTSGDYNLVAIYTFANISEELTIRFSGYCADISDCTIVSSLSIEYSATKPETEHVHSYTETSRTGDACTGYTVTYTCSECQDSYTQFVWDGVVGHKYAEESRTEPTCGVDGSVVYTCSACGDTFTVTLPALGHTWGEWTVTTAPTADTTGTLTRTCSVCEETDTFELPVLSETAYRVVTKAATCTAEGSKTYFYTHEGKEYEVTTVTLPATGHDWGAWTVTKAPTATASGELTKTCKNDPSHTETATLPKLDETNYTYAVTKEATCTETGTATYTYVKDGQNIVAATVTLPATGHEWGAWSVTTEPTAEAEGALTRTCSVCEETETVTLPVLSETAYRVETVEATCTTAGSKTYYYTHNEVEYEVTTVTLSATGHDWGEWSVTKAPTETTSGTLTRTCENDASHTETFSLPMLNKTDYTYAVTEEATCTETGTATYTYVKDEQSILAATVTLPAKGHSYSDEWATDGTQHWHECTVCGDKTDVGAHSGGTATCCDKAVCDVCGKEYGELDADNHAGGTEIRDAVAATEETEGYTGDKYCLGCGVLLEEGTVIEKLDHTHNMEYHEAVAATCTTDGMQEYWECTVCEKHYADADGISEISDLSSLVIPAAHTWGAWTVTNDPTAEATGAMERECSVCHETDTAELPALNTTDYTYKVVSAPTCTATGSATYTYKSNTSIVITVSLPLAEHTFGAWTVTTAPTAEAEGALTRTCSVCEETETATLPALNETDYRVETKAATCTADGRKTYFYTYEEVEYEVTTVTLPATGHEWGAWTVTKAPTETTTGTLMRTCENDASHTETFTLPKLDNTNYAYAVTKEATCTETGTATYTYEKDGQKIVAATVMLPALGHDWSAWAVTTKPTAEAEGALTRTCSVCEEAETATLPALNKSDYRVVTKAATCTAAGSETYYYTYNEVEYEVATVTLPALGHEWGAWSVTAAPTAEATGTLTRTCSVCEEAETATLPKLNAEDYAYAVTKNATCTETGTATYTYEKDGQNILAATVTLPALGHDPALGHEWGEWSVTAAPTAEATGTLTRTCENDPVHTEIFTLPKLDKTNYSYAVTKSATCTETGTATYTYEKDGQNILAATVTLPALGHESVTKAPTAEATGTLMRTCSVCEEAETATLPKLDKTNYSYAVTKNATCTETGTATYTYVKDGQSILAATVTLPALGHEWGEWSVTKAPTYTEKGTESRTCSVCNETETRDVPALGLTAKFADEVEALGEATTRAEKFEAISLALTTYSGLTADERTEVSEAYATLEEAIEAYNSSSEAVNDELVSATQLALSIIASTAATMSALAAAWFVVKKLF